MGDGNFRPPQNKPPWPITKKIWYRRLHWRSLRLRQIWCKSVDGGFWANGWNITNFFYLFIYIFFLSTYLQVRRDDRFSRLMAQTTRTRARMCLLGVSLTSHPILGVKYPKNPNFWGVNRRFQAKRAKYYWEKFHLVELNVLIKFHQNNQKVIYFWRFDLCQRPLSEEAGTRSSSSGSWRDKLVSSQESGRNSGQSWIWGESSADVVWWKDVWKTEKGSHPDI